MRTPSHIIGAIQGEKYFHHEILLSAPKEWSCLYQPFPCNSCSSPATATFLALSTFVLLVHPAHFKKPRGHREERSLGLNLAP